MSTKIYDAYRMPRTVDLFDFQARMRELANPVRDRLDAAEIVVRAAALYIEDCFFIHERRTRQTDALAAAGPMTVAAYEYEDEQMKENPSSIFHDPHRLEASFVAHGDWIGVKFFVSQRGYEGVIEQLCAEFDMVDYHYQDQTDQPDEVDDEEWGQRRAFWDAAVGDDAWSERGLSFTLRSNRAVLLDQRAIRAAANDSMLPAPSDSARRVARNLIGRAARDRVAREKLWPLVRQPLPEVLLARVEAALPELTLETILAPALRPQVTLADDDMRQLAALTVDRFLAGS